MHPHQENQTDTEKEVPLSKLKQEMLDKKEKKKEKKNNFNNQIKPLKSDYWSEARNLINLTRNLLNDCFNMVNEIKTATNDFADELTAAETDIANYFNKINRLIPHIKTGIVLSEDKMKFYDCCFKVEVIFTDIKTVILNPLSELTLSISNSVDKSSNQ